MPTRDSHSAGWASSSAWEATQGRATLRRRACGPAFARDRGTERARRPRTDASSISRPSSFCTSPVMPRCCVGPAGRAPSAPDRATCSRPSSVHHAVAVAFEQRHQRLHLRSARHAAPAYASKPTRPPSSSGLRPRRRSSATARDQRLEHAPGIGIDDRERPARRATGSSRCSQGTPVNCARWVTSWIAIQRRKSRGGNAKRFSSASTLAPT